MKKIILLAVLVCTATLQSMSEVIDGVRYTAGTLEAIPRSASDFKYAIAGPSDINTITSANILSQVTLKVMITVGSWSNHDLRNEYVEVTLPVTHVADFSGCPKLTSVSIPNSVTFLSERAFAGCHALSSVTLSGSLDIIPREAFRDCTSLTTIDIPPSVTSIDYQAFKGCKVLEAVTGMRRVNQICGEAFANCKKLRFVFPEVIENVPELDGYEYISDGAFSGCESMEKVVIPSGFYKIGAKAFSGCTALQEVFIPNSITEIEMDGGFGDCTSLWYLNIDAEECEEDWFRGLQSLQRVDFGPNVKTIASGAFRGCSNIYIAYFPYEGLQTIGKEAFYGCTCLASDYYPLIIPNSVDSIGESAFQSCDLSMGMQLPEGLKSIENSVFRNCVGLKEIVVPVGVTEIKSYAFSGCENLNAVQVPNTLQRIGGAAFDNCESLEYFICYAEDPPSIESSTFYGVNVQDVILYVPKDAIEKYRSDEYWKVFFTHTNIQFEDPLVKAISVACWDTDLDGELSYEEAAVVTDIGSVFRYNTEITYFDELRYFTGLEYLESDAFAGCINLFNITIPKNVSFMGYGNPFQNCRLLAYIKVDKENKYFDSRNDCNAIIEKESNTLISGCFRTVIPDDVEMIGEGAFMGNWGSMSISIPNKVKTIGPYAFSGCAGLKEITIPNSVTTIGQSAFFNCGSLSSVTIPRNVTNIGKQAFTFCTGLTSIKVNSGNVAYDSRNNCNAIIDKAADKLLFGCRNTIIPDGITSIGDYAFEGLGYQTNEGLTSINIPSSVTSIGDHAFASCSKLKVIYCDAVEPPHVSEFTFNFNVNGVKPDEITLYVPGVSYQEYEKHPIWGQLNIVRKTAIETPFADENHNTIKGYYNINGCYRMVPRPGINIIRLSDGTTRKILVR